MGLADQAWLPGLSRVNGNRASRRLAVVAASVAHSLRDSGDIGHSRQPRADVAS
jgi:hypothetical protein